MFVLDAIGFHIELAYSIVGRVIALYVSTIVSFCFPHCVAVRALRIFMDFCAFSFVLSMCCL